MINDVLDIIADSRQNHHVLNARAANMFDFIFLISR